MRRLQYGLGCLLIALLGSGCQATGPSPSPTASASAASTLFTGQVLPPEVQRLTGTPYYGTSDELAGQIPGLNGAPFLLMAPQNPTVALLVVESGSQPADVKERPSQLTDFSGRTERLDNPEAVKAVRESTGLDLLQENGQIIVLRISSPGVAPAAASPTPGATP